MRMMTREEGAPGRGSSRGMPNTVHERQFTLSSVRFGFVSCLLGPGGCALRHVMVVASKCLDVERGRILSDSVTSRSGSVGRALTARDSSLRSASCALVSGTKFGSAGPGPRRERHGRRVDVQCGDNRIARSPSRVPGARGFAPRAVGYGYGCRAVPGHLRLRGQKRCCRSAHSPC